MAPELMLGIYHAFHAGDKQRVLELQALVHELAATVNKLPVPWGIKVALEVQGFSAGQGQAAIANSRSMADSVVRYLVLNHEIPSYRMYVLGLGNASAAEHAGGARVEISILKNDLAASQ